MSVRTIQLAIRKLGERGHLRQRFFLHLVLLAVLLGASRAFAAEISPAELENRRCLTCHGQSQIAQLDPQQRAQMVASSLSPLPPNVPEVRPELQISDEKLHQSVHAALACTSCHSQAKSLPHKARMAKATCDDAGCHAHQADAYLHSSHALAAAKGNPNAPTCVTCHGGHDVLAKTDRQSRTFPLNVVKMCASCHEKYVGKTAGGLNEKKEIAKYLESVHGRAVLQAGLTVAATCADCHGPHDVRPASDPESKVHRNNIPYTCGKCHVGIIEMYAKSVHGEQLAKGDAKAPVCSDCHTAHAISRTDSPKFMLDIVAECGTCHENLYDSYRASYHGQVTALGYSRAARCSDCHGAHDILAIDNPANPLYGANRIDVCRKCHPDAGPKFASFAPHANFHDGARFPILHAIFLYFVIMMSASFGFFGFHCILWGFRSAIERILHGPRPKHDYSKGTIQRFTRVDRVNHGLVIITFFGLALTGLPLLYSDKEWAQALANILGGVSSCGIIHRVFAIMLIGNILVHGVGVFRRFRKHGVKQMLFGPTTMLPTKKDLFDCLGMFKWFLTGRGKPKFERWTYWEKFDYTAEVGGSGIIGISGLLLWFPAFFSHYLPGWIFNAASMIHGFEALLAVGFIFTIHFFNAHLRLEKFPVDDVMFTGRLPEEEFKHERAAEYERVAAAGQLDALRAKPPHPMYRRFAVGLGALAMAVGTTIVVLIILAALKAI